MAVWVLLGHLSASIMLRLPHIPANLSNTSAVDVFIILSGFAIAALVDKSNEPYRIYIARRALRIFPVYWFYLSISIALAVLLPTVWQDAPGGAMKAARSEILTDALANFWVNIVTHIPALHGIVPDRIVPSGAFAFLGQAWSISLEWQFYLIAPFAISLLLAARRNWVIALEVVLILLALAYLSRPMPMGFIGHYAIFFAIGIATHHLIKWQQVNQVPAGSLAAIAVLCVGAMVLLNVRSVLPLSIWVAVSASVMAHVNGHKSWLSNLLTMPVALWIGTRSYSVYLAHMVPLTIGMAWLEYAGVTHSILHAILLLVITIIGTALLTYFSYKWIEEPFQKVGKSLSIAKRAEAS